MKYVFILFSLIVIVSCQNPYKTKETKSENTMDVKKETFGKVENQEVFLYTLSNNNGMIVKITNYGGIVTSIIVPDKDGNFDDVVMGYNKFEGYLNNDPYFGAIVGRYANRIAKGKFTIDGIEYILATNNGPNHLHGGLKAFDKVVWNAVEFKDKEVVGIKLHYLSKDGEEGYPGNLDAFVTYTLTNQYEVKLDY